MAGIDIGTCTIRTPHGTGVAAYAISIPHICTAHLYRTSVPNITQHRRGSIRYVGIAHRITARIAHRTAKTAQKSKEKKDMSRTNCTRPMRNCL
eukprot:800478-Rhodomonas_salina.2